MFPSACALRTDEPTEPPPTAKLTVRREARISAAATSMRVAVEEPAVFEHYRSTRGQQPVPTGPDPVLSVGSQQSSYGLAHPHQPEPAASTHQPDRPYRSWQRWHRRLLVVLDLAALLGSAVLGLVAGGRTGGVLVGLGLVAAWLLTLVFSGCYDLGQVGGGTAEMRRVLGTPVRIGFAVGLAAYLVHAESERMLILITLAAGTLLLPAGRLVARGVLVSARRRGHYRSRVLAVGAVREVARLTEQARRSPGAGLDIIAACVPQPTSAEHRRHNDLTELTSLGVPVAGTPQTVPAAASSCRADTVIIAGHTVLSRRALRRLAWQLDGARLRLYVASPLSEADTQRIALRAVGDLSALDVQPAALGSSRRVLKAALDRVLAAVLLVLTAPLLLVLAALVGLTSRGPVLDRQRRVGVGGRTFDRLRLRTTRVGADQAVTTPPDQSRTDRPPPEAPTTPLLTAVGRVLRRCSLDELPQLFNVLGGSMSLVGPRPPLPSEVAVTGGEVRRRLLVKPGITGLWRVCGGKDLSWADSVRLDLSYVENWSPLLDLSIMARTVPAVVHGHRAP